MAAQAPKASPHPPELPFMPDVSPTMSNYLRTFSLWAKTGLAGKIDGQTALPGSLLQSHDTAPRSTPKVFKFQVNEAGVASLAPVALGSPATPDPPGAAIPIFPEAPSDGGSYVRNNGTWVAAVPASGGAFTGPISAPSATVSGLLTVGSAAFSALPVNAANDAAAATAGVPVGGIYRNGSILMVRAA